MSEPGEHRYQHGGSDAKGGRWRRRDRRGYAVRKILKVTRSLRAIYAAAAISAFMAAIGIVFYLAVFPSSVVLVEAFVWLIEAISFSGLAVAFSIAASRTVKSRERFEILRIEALVALHVALAGLIITLFIVGKSVLSPPKEPTPLWLSAYPLGSAVISYLLERWLHGKLHALEVKFASLRFVADKLKLDVALEAAGGLSIIASNLTGIRVFEVVLVVAVGLYVFYGLSSIAAHNLLYLVGPGPRTERDKVRKAITLVLEGMGYKVRTIRVESYGTFAEAEVWVEYPYDAPLMEAYNKSRRIARELVARVPELLRSVVVMVPVKTKTVKRYRRSAENRVEKREEARGEGSSEDKGKEVEGGSQGLG